MTRAGRCLSAGMVRPRRSQLAEPCLLGSSRATITRPSEYLTSRGAVPVGWDEMTRSGSCRGVRVRVLRDHPDRRGAAGEVIGSNNGRLTPLPRRSPIIVRGSLSRWRCLSSPAGLLCAHCSARAEYSGRRRTRAKRSIRSRELGGMRASSQEISPQEQDPDEKVRACHKQLLSTRCGSSTVRSVHTNYHPSGFHDRVPHPIPSLTGG